MSLQILIAVDLRRNGFPQGSQQSLSLIGDAAGERRAVGAGRDVHAAGDRPER